LLFGLIVGLIVLSLAVPSWCAAITSLPNYSGPSLQMYSGYIPVNDGRNLFYWLIESENDPTNDPLVVWFQGGPGCSSLFGLFQENGPLRVSTNLSVYYSDLSWTQYANMLWVESPAGVGFSYPADPTNDNQTAADNYLFLQNFMATYPQFQKNKLWLTGESYGGIYVPTLTNLVLANKTSALYSQLNGIMLGNPYLACNSLWATNRVISVQFNLLYWHGLVDYSTYQNWTSQNCDANPSQPICNTILQDAENQIGVIYQETVTGAPHLPSLDPDDLYQDFCTGNGSLEYSETVASLCVPLGNDVTNYLNLATVQKAINAKPVAWSACSSTLNYTGYGVSMIPFFQQFLANKPSLQVLVYSGDVDIMTIPFAFTQQCMSEFNATTTKKWHPWYVNDWTAGYVEYNKIFTYATLKGAGHESPEYQPLNAFNMFGRFLTNGNLDAPKSSVSSQQQQQLLKKRLASVLRSKEYGTIRSQSHALRINGIF